MIGHRTDPCGTPDVHRGDHRKLTVNHDLLHSTCQDVFNPFQGTYSNAVKIPAFSEGADVVSPRKL